MNDNMWVFVLAAGAEPRARKPTSTRSGYAIPTPLYSHRSRPPLLQQALRRAALMGSRAVVRTIVAAPHRRRWVCSPSMWTM